MNQVRLFPAQQVKHFSLALFRMNHVPYHEQPPWTRRHCDFVVAARIAYYGVTTMLEQVAFGRDGDVFAAGLLISIVYNDDFHRIVEICRSIKELLQLAAEIQMVWR